MRSLAPVLAALELLASTLAVADSTSDAALKHWSDAAPLKDGASPALKAGRVLDAPAAHELRAAIASFREKDDSKRDVCLTDDASAGPIRVQGCNRIDATYDLLVIGCDVATYGEVVFAAIADHAGAVSDMRQLVLAYGDMGVGLSTGATFKAGRFIVWDVGGQVVGNQVVRISGSSHELVTAPGGHFLEDKKVARAFMGEYRDPATREELKLEQDDQMVRVYYRRAHDAGWRPMDLVSLDPFARQLVVRFGSAPTTYALTVDFLRATLLSVGSDGSKAQKFVLLPKQPSAP
jgi:hypothetical protein